MMKTYEIYPRTLWHRPWIIRESSKNLAETKPGTWNSYSKTNWDLSKERDVARHFCIQEQCGGTFWGSCNGYHSEFFRKPFVVQINVLWFVYACTCVSKHFYTATYEMRSVRENCFPYLQGALACTSLVTHCAIVNDQERILELTSSFTSCILHNQFHSHQEQRWFSKRF